MTPTSLRLVAASFAFAILCSLAALFGTSAMPWTLCVTWALGASVWGFTLGRSETPRVGLQWLGALLGVFGGGVLGFLGASLGLYADSFVHYRLPNISHYLGIVLVVVVGAFAGCVASILGLGLGAFGFMNWQSDGYARFRQGLPFWVRAATLGAGMIGLLAILLVISPLLPGPDGDATQGMDAAMAGLVFVVFVALLVAGNHLYFDRGPELPTLPKRYLIAGAEGAVLSLVGLIVASVGLPQMETVSKERKLQALIELVEIENGSARERAAAADELAKFGPEADRAVPALALALRDQRPDEMFHFRRIQLPPARRQLPVSAHAHEALVKIGTPAAEAARKANAPVKRP